MSVYIGTCDSVNKQLMRVVSATNKEIKHFKHDLHASRNLNDSLSYELNECTQIGKNAITNCKQQLSRHALWDTVKNYGLVILGTTSIIGWAAFVLKP